MSRAVRLAGRVVRPRPMLPVGAMAGIALLLAACAASVQTLRPADTTGPAIQAAVTRPAGAGPFPAVVLLHGCAGPGVHAEIWAHQLAAHGYLVAAADQFTPRGITRVCESGRLMIASFINRYIDTVTLVRLVQQRPDVRADRVFVIGFSHGGHVAGTMAGSFMDLMAPDHPSNLGGGPPLRAVISVYPNCDGLPVTLQRPLLVAVGADDDLTPADRCPPYVQRVGSAPITPEIVIYPDAHHGFDDIRNPGRYAAPFYNRFSPTGSGATLGYNQTAHRALERDVLAFLDRHR